MTNLTQAPFVVLAGGRASRNPVARTNSAARWRAALDRARKEGIAVRQLSASGAWVATSAADAHVAYEVSVHRCTCPAAVLGDDPVCKHRAALRVHVGVPLALDCDPDDALAA